MTGTLQLSVQLAEEWSHLTSGVAVRIECVERGAFGEGRTWSVLVPTGTRGLPLEVSAGTYRMQAWLPSGRILGRSATVQEGGTALVEFREVRRGERNASTTAPPERSVDLSKEYDPSEFQPAFATSSDPFTDDVRPARIDIVHETPSALSWSDFSLADDQSEWAHEDVVPDATTLASVHADQFTAVFSLDVDRTARPLSMGYHRHWVRLRHESGTSLGALPLPWLAGDPQGADASIEVSYERLRQRLGISVRDAAMDMLLAYLRYGRLSAAEMSIEVLMERGAIVQAIEGKRSNPIAACAAAYVSLATANRKQIDTWRHWAPNLMDWFPWMPDGAIVRACVLMDGPVTEQSRDEILSLAKVAFGRGLPFFSVGIRHLREMLSIFGSEDAEAKEMLDFVRRISSRCDVAEAFTTLQFPSH